MPNADGTVTVVVATAPADHPNAITTMDYPRGNLAFRWFLPDAVPEPPEVTLVEAGRRRAADSIACRWTPRFDAERLGSQRAQTMSGA